MSQVWSAEREDAGVVAKLERLERLLRDETRGESVRRMVAELGKEITSAPR